MPFYEVDYSRGRYSRLKNDDISPEEFSSWSRLHTCHSKLKNASEISSVMSYFAVLAVAELKLKVHSVDARPDLITALVCTTSLLVSTSMVLKVVCCSILPFINITEIHDVDRSPHEAMLPFINAVWVLASVFAPLLFIADIVILCYIKYRILAIEAVYGATVIMLGLVIAMAIFGVLIRRRSKSRRRRIFLSNLRQTLSSAEFTIISVESLSSASTYRSEKDSLMKNSAHLSSWYGSMDSKNALEIFGFGQGQIDMA